MYHNRSVGYIEIGLIPDRLINALDRENPRWILHQQAQDLIFDLRQFYLFTANPHLVEIQTDYDTVSYPLIELGWKLNEQINPIMYTKDEWAANSITPFYDNVVRDGISLI